MIGELKNEIREAILEGDLEMDFSAAYNFLIHLGKERDLTKKQSVE